MAYQVKNLPAMQETQETWGSAPGLGRSPGGGKGTPLQYSHQENPLDREAWWATAHGITKSWTQLMSEHRAHVKRPALPQLNCELPTSCTPKFMIPTLQMRKLRYYTPSPAGLIFQFGGKGCDHSHHSRTGTSLGGKFMEAAGGHWSGLQPDPQICPETPGRNKVEVSILTPSTSQRQGPWRCSWNS